MSQNTRLATFNSPNWSPQAGPLAAVLCALVWCPLTDVRAAASSRSPSEVKQPRPTKTTRPAVPEGVVIERDVAYLPPERIEKLDLYLPAERSASERSPAVLIIHGGGWAGGVKDAGREFNIGTTLAKAGYVCASVEVLESGTESLAH